MCKCTLLDSRHKVVIKIAFYLFGPVLRFRGEIVVGVVSLSDPTEQHSYYT